MIKVPEVHRNFPTGIVVYRATLLLLTLVLGGLVTWQVGLLAFILYIAFAVGAILWTMAHSCKHCYYHGRRCDLGVSLLATVLHRTGGSTKLFFGYTRVAIWLLGGLLVLPLLIDLVAWIAGGQTALLAIVLTYAVFMTAAVLTTMLSCPNCAMRNICPLSFYRPVAH